MMRPVLVRLTHDLDIPRIATIDNDRYSERVGMPWTYS